MRKLAKRRLSVILCERSILRSMWYSALDAFRDRMLVLRPLGVRDRPLQTTETHSKHLNV